MMTTTRLFLIVSALCSIIFIVGCSPTNVTGSEGIPDSGFRGIKPVYADGKTVGNLTEAYVKNTESLITVNGRLDVLCAANEIEVCGPQ
jgi:hypothetical protein